MKRYIVFAETQGHDQKLLGEYDTFSKAKKEAKKMCDKFSEWYNKYYYEHKKFHNPTQIHEGNDIVVQDIKTGRAWLYTSDWEHLGIMRIYDFWKVKGSFSGNKIRKR